jgi:putative nucleotidyltransferase with HDIG domain
MAEGNMCVRFESERKDDIGILARSMDTMSLNLKHRFDSMHTMNRIDRAVLSSVSRRELLFNVAGYISEQFDNAAVAVMSHREEGLLLTAMIPHYSNLDDRLILYSSLEHVDEGEAGENEILELDRESHAGQHLQKLRIFPPELIRNKLVIIPIHHNEKRVASFMITRDSFSELDLEALGMLADQAGVALKSMFEREQRDQLGQGTLMALTRSVDAKSRWTAGHSGRVARLAEALAKRMELPPEMVQTVRISALLHDIGKLGIPEAILDKPGRLSDEEFALIKSHPEKGDTIIREIPGFEEIRLGVRHHHEKWDGSGYPDGLKGKEIPLIARILTLADVYDAVTEDRPYRKGFSRERLAQFMEEQRALLFDPELLDAFLPLVTEGS